MAETVNSPFILVRVLARAVTWHTKRRVIIAGSKTIVFA